MTYDLFFWGAGEAKKNDDALEMNLNSSSQLFYPITRNYFRHKI